MATGLISCLDVYYTEEKADAAAVVLADWQAGSPLSRYTATVKGVAQYEPGRFYLRELLPIQAVIAKIVEPIDVYVIDGYCHLSPDHTPGLGAYLHEALGGAVSVVGVAKNRYRDTTHAVEVLRAGSVRPLFVTSIGLAYDAAAQRIASMAGKYRIPDLIKAADRLSRGGEKEDLAARKGECTSF